MTVYLQGERRAVERYRREHLHPGQHFAGPAIVAQDDCTTCVLPGMRGRVDAYRNLVIELEGA